MQKAFELVEKSLDSAHRGYFFGEVLYFDKPAVEDGKFVFKPNMVKYKVATDSEMGKKIAKSIIDKETGEILVDTNAEITEEIIEKLMASGDLVFSTLYSNDLDHGDYISQTLASDEVPGEYEAKVAIYRMMRPGEPPTEIGRAHV